METECKKTIKVIKDINNISLLNGYNETEFNIIKDFVNIIKENYKPEKGKNDWFKNLYEKCFYLAEKMRNETYKDYLDNINETRKLGVTQGNLLEMIDLLTIYIPGYIGINLYFNKDNYQEKDQDYILLYRFDPEQHSDHIPIMFGREFENVREDQYCYIIDL